MLTGVLAKLMNLLDFRKNLPPVIRELYRPMLYLSLGLHWAILIVPLPEEAPSVEETETPAVEEQVKLSQLLAPTKPSPSPLPKVSPASPPPTPKTVTQPPAPVSPKAIPAPEEAVAEEEKELAPEVEETTTPEVEATPTPEAEQESQIEEDREETAIATVEATPTPTPEAEAKPEEVAAAFQSVFGNVDANPDELVDANLFAQPEFFFTPDSLNLDSDPVKQAGINRIQWISLKKPDRVMEEMLEPDLQSSGISVVSQGEYGGGTVYELNKDGTVLGYLNLVPTKGSIGTMIVVWNQNPNSGVE